MWLAMSLSARSQRRRRQAETPGGAGDLVGEGVFEQAGGAEFLEHGVEEVFVEGGFVGEDKIVSCKES